MLSLPCECRLQSGYSHRPVPDTVGLSVAQQDIVQGCLGLQQGLIVVIKYFDQVEGNSAGDFWRAHYGVMVVAISPNGGNSAT